MELNVLKVQAQAHAIHFTGRTLRWLLLLCHHDWRCSQDPHRYLQAGWLRSVRKRALWDWGDFPGPSQGWIHLGWCRGWHRGHHESHRYQVQGGKVSEGSYVSVAVCAQTHHPSVMAARDFNRRQSIFMSFRFILRNTTWLAPFPWWRYVRTRISKCAVHAQQGLGRLT